MKMIKAVLEIGQYLKNAKTKALKSLGATLDFIDIWLKFSLGNYDARCDAYINSMIEMFNKISQTMSQPLTPEQKSRNL